MLDPSCMSCFPQSDLLHSLIYEYAYMCIFHTRGIFFTKDLLVNSSRYFISIKQCMTVTRSWVMCLLFQQDTSNTVILSQSIIQGIKRSPVEHSSRYILYKQRGEVYRHQTASVALMISVLASSAVDRGFEPPSGQTKDYKIDICCFSLSTQH